MPPTPRNTAGTRFLTDVLREPRLWRVGLQGGDPEVAERDLRDGLPLRAVAHLRSGRGYWQGLLGMDLSAPEQITWSRWRLSASRMVPVPLLPPYEVVSVREPSVLQVLALGDVRLLTVDAGGAVWKLAVTPIDVPVITAAFALARGGDAPA